MTFSFSQCLYSFISTQMLISADLLGAVVATAAIQIDSTCSAQKNCRTVILAESLLWFSVTENNCTSTLRYITSTEYWLLTSDLHERAGKWRGKIEGKGKALARYIPVEIMKSWCIYRCLQTDNWFCGTFLKLAGADVVWDLQQINRTSFRCRCFMMNM